MTSEIKRDEFDKYIINVISLHRKIMLILFELELTKNEELRNRVEIIKNKSEIDKAFFFFEGIIDFKSMILLLKDFNSKGKFGLLIDVSKDNENKILKDVLKNSLKLRTDLWHNCIEYNNPQKYYQIISSIKIAYEIFQNNKAIMFRYIKINYINILIL